MRTQAESLADIAMENLYFHRIVEIPEVPDAPRIKMVLNPRLGIPSTYSPGHSLLIEGLNLEINQLDPDEGVFLLPLSREPERRLTIYIINRRDELLVLIPLAVRGPQHLQIRTRDANGEILYTIHPTILVQA